MIKIEKISNITLGNFWEDLRAKTSSNTVKRLYSNFAYNFLEFSARLITRESEWPKLI